MNIIFIEPVYKTAFLFLYKCFIRLGIPWNFMQLFFKGGGTAAYPPERVFTGVKE